MSQVTTMSRGAARPTVALAALAAIALSLAYLIQPTLAGVEPYQVPLHEAQQGADSSTFSPADDCGDFTSGVVWHFVLNQYDGNDTAHLVADFQTAGTLEADASKDNGGTQHFYLNTPTDDILNNAYAEVASAPGSAKLVLSHVCHTGVENTAALMIRKTSTILDPYILGHYPYLAGAVFEVEGIDGTFVTNEDGFFCITGLPQNSKWTVTEIQAPEGYELADPASQLVQVDNTSDCTSREAVFRNAPKQQEESPTPTPEESVAESVQESVAESVQESVAESVQESVAESVQESVAESVQESVAESVQESVAESVQESVAESTTQSPEGEVEGATGTPEASLPDGAMGGGNGSNPLPTVLFSLILLASLGTLAYANVRTVRNRS